jgi:hypothetical protein
VSDIFRFQGQRLLMQRIGSVNPTRQRDGAPIFDRDQANVPRLRGKNPRAPERRGVWAFPYPLFDAYFSSFQHELALPKHLLELRQRSYDEKSTREEQDRYYEEYEVWSKLETTKARLRVRQFWVSGELYTHLGNSGDDSEWNLMPVGEFARALRKQYAHDLADSKKSFSPGEPGITKAPGYHHRAHHGAWPVSVDHLEVFLGRGAKIH